MWDVEDLIPDEFRKQTAVRWYAEALGGSDKLDSGISSTDAPIHRRSSDISIDNAIGKTVGKHNHREFERFGEEQHSLLLWNIKNIEYALGANISDLSMKFWDSDERHAFEGDHVLLRCGYSAVVDYMEAKLKERGNKFRCIFDCPVQKVEYARKSQTLPYTASDTGGFRKLVELSDSCSIIAGEEEVSYKCDFTVCTLPLGVLKASISRNEHEIGKVEFDPPLPFSKVDAIQNTGFGLLNKVYLQFPYAFWRLKSLFDEDQTLFGNASGVNPHHYMFNDIGKSLQKNGDAPAVLMSLISGREAVTCERRSDKELVDEVVHTLRTLFSTDIVPDPISFRVTRWGTDRFARGSYTFLPPGSSDQDFHILQSPINGNGDSLVLEGSETMRLFWAGEHTTALHPSMAHGAMMSGIRAAKEVLSTIQFNYNDERSNFEKMIPLSIFRIKNPSTKLQCNFCHKVGSRVREGSLLAFQKGSRQVLVHNNCGENSPEVEVRDGQWKSVIKAVNRGKQIYCCICGSVGATIGCTHDNCFRSFHFSCAEDTGYRFERDGKVFFCDLHRDYNRNMESQCDRISISFYQSKNPSTPLKCSFCGVISPPEGGQRGKVIAFQQQNRQLLVHDKCARYTNLIETLEDPKSTNEFDFRNIFEACALSKVCVMCFEGGATIQCTDGSCNCHFHFTCAEETGWNFGNRGLAFKCKSHRGHKNDFHPLLLAETLVSTTTPLDLHLGNGSSPFSHNLFRKRGDIPFNNMSQNLSSGSIALNLEMGQSRHEISGQQSANKMAEDPIIFSSDEEDIISNPILQTLSLLQLPISNHNRDVIKLTRESTALPWGFSFVVQNLDPKTAILGLELKRQEEERAIQLLFVESINGIRIGFEIKNLLDAFAVLKSGLELIVVVYVESMKELPLSFNT